MIKTKAFTLKRAAMWQLRAFYVFVIVAILPLAGCAINYEAPLLTVPVKPGTQKSHLAIGYMLTPEIKQYVFNKSPIGRSDYTLNIPAGAIIEAQLTTDLAAQFDKVGLVTAPTPTGQWDAVIVLRKVPDLLYTYRDY